VAGNYASVNGIELYYETYGMGRPLVMLHGGFGTTGMFAQVIPSLSATRQVIAVELQAHGHTADIDRPLRFELMADDVATLIKHLGLESADVLGYSLGGGVALQTAIRHPEVVRKLVIAAATFARDGWYPESLAAMSGLSVEFLSGTILHDAYLAAAPRPEDWPVLVTKLRQLLSEDYNWAEAVAAIKAPALLIYGDADSIRMDHIVEMFGLFGGGKVDGGLTGRPPSQLAILPNTPHWDVPSRADLLLPIILPFLDTPTPESTSDGTR
jgi:pimeloyl-ACP methyl ester carboxylesterase